MDIDENNNTADFQEANNTVDVDDTDTVRKKKRKPIIGILSLICAGASWVPMLGVVSLVGLVLSLIALFRENKLIALAGMVFSAISIVFSPTAWLAVAMYYCLILDCPQSQPTTTTPAAAQQQPIAAPVTSAAAPIEMSTSVSASVRFPQGWEPKGFSENPSAASKSMHAIHGQDNFLMERYTTSPDYTAIFQFGFWNKEPADSIDAFITKHMESFRPYYTTLQVTPMDPITINNSGDAALNTAHLRLMSDAAGHEEVVAFIDGGSRVFTLIMAAANRDELMKAWPVFSDALLKGVNFSVGQPQAETPAPVAPAPPAPATPVELTPTQPAPAQ